MRELLILFLAVALASGCAPAPKPGITVEASSPIIGREQTLVESLDIETLGGVFTPLVTARQKVPAEVSEVFSTAADNQDQIKIRLYRGSAKITAQNTFLGEFQIVGIPPASRGTPQIEVALRVDDGEIRISARDLDAGKEMHIKRIEPQPADATDG